MSGVIIGLENRSKKRKIMPVVHVEVRRRIGGNSSESLVRDAVKNLNLIPGSIMKEFSDPLLKSQVEMVHVCELSDDVKSEEGSGMEYKIYVYHLNEEGGQDLYVNGESESIVAAQHWALPSADFEGLWDSLIYDTNIKDNLLNFAETAMLFSDRNVNPNLITWNRVVLLHGPPGTGKTSLCKAIAQKLAVRLAHRYSRAEFIEINSHSLFSKWFSESGKLVMKMFSKIREIKDDQSALVFILIDEVESLAHARKASISGAEPSDAMRVVNAVLTQIDQIKHYSNVLILTTSNITASIDLAFVDRADIKQYIGHPSSRAVYSIFQSCITELQRTGIVNSTDKIMSLKLLELSAFEHNASTDLSLKLFEIAKKCQGLSGRSLRKLPFLAHAFYLHNVSSSLEIFLAALENAVQKQKTDILQLQDS